jgi:hypothetical protein
MPKWLNRVRNTLKRKTRSGTRKLQNLAYKARRAFSTKAQRQKLLNKRFETLKRRMEENNPNWEANYVKNLKRLREAKEEKARANAAKAAAAAAEEEEARAAAAAPPAAAAAPPAAPAARLRAYQRYNNNAANVLGSNYNY